MGQTSHKRIDRQWDGTRDMKLLANRKALAIAAAIGLIASLSVWALSRDEALAEMTLQVDKGSVEIQRGDGAIPAVGRTGIEAGDVVVTADNSYATLRLEGERVISLGPAASLEILGGTGVSSGAGTLVADAGDPLRVAIGDAMARGDQAVVRVDRSAGTTRAGVYEGRLDLAAPGSPGVSLERLWQATLTAGRLYGREPYELKDGDVWDGRHLDSLVALDARLTTMRSGFASLVGRSLPGLDFFAALVDQDVGFLRTHVDKLTPKRPLRTADLMIGVAVAKPAAGPLEPDFRRGYGYFRQGASWGIVAGLLGVENPKEWKPVVDELEVAMLGSAGVADGDPGDATFTVAEGDGETTAPGDSVDGSGEPVDEGAPGDGPGALPPTQPPDGGDDDDDDGSDDDDDNNGTPSPSPACDIQCEVEKIVPTPLPTTSLESFGN